MTPKTVPDGTRDGPKMELSTAGRKFMPPCTDKKSRAISLIYEHVTALFREGIWVVCVDEKTSSQAREAQQASRLSVFQHPVYQFPRYHQHRTFNLIGALTTLKSKFRQDRNSFPGSYYANSSPSSGSCRREEVKPIASMRAN
jgi:hypothetical protein